MHQDDRKANKVGRAWHAIKLSSVGIEMAVATAIGWGIGYWLDMKLGTGPWLMLVFLLLGIAAGFKGLIRAAREAQEGTRGKSDGVGEAETSPTESNQ